MAGENDTGTDLALEIPGAGEDDPQGAIESALEDGADGLDLDGLDDGDDDSPTGKQGDKDGTKPKGERPPKAPAKDKPRTLAELNKLLEDDPSFKMSAEERRRVQTAARFKISTEEELDAKLAELDGQGKTSQKTSKDPSKNPPASKTPEGDLEEEPQEDEDSDLYKHLPNVPKGDKVKAVAALKALNKRASAYGALANTVREYGFEKPEDAIQAVQTLNDIDTTIAEKLKTPEGLRELYKSYAEAGVQMPPFLAQGAPPAWGSPAAPAGAPANAAGAAPPQDLFKDLEDGEYISVGDVRKALPNLIASEIAKAIPGALGPMQQTFQRLAPVLRDLTAKTQRETALSTALRDVTSAAQSMAAINPAYKFQDSLETVWSQSVGPDGKVLPEPHPEWKKLEKLLTVRRQAMAKKYPTLAAYLAEQALTRGGLAKVHKDAKTAARVEVVQGQARRLQPPLNTGRKLPADTFKIPKTPEEADRMKKENPEGWKRWREMLKRGEVKVKA